MTCLLEHGEGRTGGGAGIIKCDISLCILNLSSLSASISWKEWYKRNGQSAINSCVLLNPWPLLRGPHTGRMAMCGEAWTHLHKSVVRCGSAALSLSWSQELIFQMNSIFRTFCQHCKFKIASNLCVLIYSLQKGESDSIFLAVHVASITRSCPCSCPCCLLSHCPATTLTWSMWSLPTALAVTPGCFLPLWPSQFWIQPPHGLQMSRNRPPVRPFLQHRALHEPCCSRHLCSACQLSMLLLQTGFWGIHSIHSENKYWGVYYMCLGYSTEV